MAKSLQYLVCASLAVFILSLSVVESAPQHEEEILEMVHILYRHGDRSPIFLYPNDPYKNESLWPEGLGQLTKKGKAMEYELGMWLRRRYKTFISPEFRANEINVVSTNYDRTLMSAQCVLAAFYYPDNVTLRFDENLAWLPTPIHTAPVGADKILNLDSACPRVSMETKKVDKLPEIKAYMKEHRELFESLSKLTGEKIDSILQVDFLYDTLHIESLYNMTLPEWTHKYMGEMKSVSDFSFAMNTYTHELKRLRGGPLLGLMTDNMLKKVSGEKESKKMLMFSAHDSTVAILLDSMGLYSGVAPPYAATVMVELYKKGDKHIVKTFYQNDSTMASPPHLLTLPGCTPECELTQWEAVLADVIPSDWSKECYRPDPELDHFYIQVLSGLCIVLGGCLATIIGFYFCYKYNLGFKVGRRSGNDLNGYEPIESIIVTSAYGSISENSNDKSKGITNIQWHSCPKSTHF